MTIDSKMQEVLDAYAALGPLPIEKLSPGEARQLPALSTATQAVVASHLLARATTPVPEPVDRVRHRLIPTRGGDVLVRIYNGKAKDEGRLPVLVYFHGGGWVIANLDGYDSSCRALANAAECIVVSVAYRQAPEHKFPAAVEDAFDAYEWVCANATSFGGDAKRVAVGGESAGGNLAAVVALLARDEGRPSPVHQLLVYPVTNHAFDTPSYEEHAHAKPLNREMMTWFWGHYLRSDADGRDPRASPLQAPDHSGLPPATVVVAEIDPLRSEGEAYAEKLRGAGVSVELRRYPGVTHEFFGMAGLIDGAKDAVAFASSELKTAFLAASLVGKTAKSPDRPIRSSLH